MRAILTATVASLALAASPVLAQGNGQGNGGGKAQGNAKAQGNSGAKGNSAAKGNAAKNERKPDKGPGKGNAGNADKPAQAQGKPDKAPQRVATPGNGNGKGNGKPSMAGPPHGKKADRVERTVVDSRRPEQVIVRDDRVVTTRVASDSRDFRWASVRTGRASFAGCPPGLAKKRPACVPPGLAKQRITYRWERPTWYGVRFDNRYRYYDGYMLRMGSGDRVLGYLPLLGGALAVGNLWPATYQPVTLPTYYVDYYGLRDQRSYRYYDDVIYRVDPETAAIQSIAALLTGNDFTVGQRIPAGYDIYNVPYPYRDRYFDTPDAYYRYSDGYVYQVDPTTRLILAAIELLA